MNGKCDRCGNEWQCDLCGNDECLMDCPICEQEDNDDTQEPVF